MKIKPQLARKIVYNDDDNWVKVESHIVDQSRWDTHCEYIVQHKTDGKHYSFYYSHGSTEQQDTSPFEDVTEDVEFTEVEQREVTKLEWVPVET